MLGADWTRDAWTAGLLVSWSKGEGSDRAEGGLELAVKSDVMAVRTSSEKVPGLAAADILAVQWRLLAWEDPKA